MNEETPVKVERFDLNDIEHEPSDEQLASLMEAVAVEARRKARIAQAELMARLRSELAAVQSRQRHET